MTSLSYKRLLVKFSGEAVAGDDDHGIDPKVLDQMAQSVKDCKELGAQIGIVIGGGNLFRCLLYTSPSPRDGLLSRMPSSA